MKPSGVWGSAACRLKKKKNNIKDGYCKVEKFTKWITRWQKYLWDQQSNEGLQNSGLLISA